MKCLKSQVVSMDRCNTCLEFTGRSFKAQSFSGTLIEAQRYLVEIGLRITGQVGFLGEVLSQQPVGVFVGASLPGLCGSQKKTCTLVATVKLLCLAISSPRSQVNERRRVAGGLRTFRLSAARTVAVSLLGTLTSMVKRECRSTSVAM